MSSKNLAVAVRGVSKKYNIVHKGQTRSTLGETLIDTLKNPFKRVEKESFWALQDINFEVHKGDVVGIIGKNGAGKSTLLKILSRIVEPTTGVIDLYGPVGSLLEVGTGFHPELTGRENIFLNGAILGMRRREIQRQFDAIVDFAGIEKFLDTPVKRYSSGMYVRLAFAVAAHLNPEILIVDEVLAVGDAEFQKKCLGKMQEVSQGEGRTVLFVSHNMAAVRQLCTSALFLQQGKVVKYGPTEGVLELYNSSQHRAQVKREVNEYGLAFGDLYLADAQTGNRTDQPVFARDYLITAHIHADKVHPYGSINLRIFDETGAKISTIASVEEGIPPTDMKGDVKVVFRVPRLGLFPGRYSMNLEVSKPHDKPFLLVEDALVFEVQPARIGDAMWCYEKHHGMIRIADGGNVSQEDSGAVPDSVSREPVTAAHGE
jgi:lipopolysaccharide transport system ATP-binding protein